MEGNLVNVHFLPHYIKVLTIVNLQTQSISHFWIVRVSKKTKLNLNLTRILRKQKRILESFTSLALYQRESGW